MKTEKTLKEIVDVLIKDGYRFQVTKNTVEKAIMSVRGIDDRTVKKWLKALQVFEYLKPVNAVVYELNPLKIPQLFELLKEKPQIKLQ